MKEHHYKELIAYASAFVSFVLPKAEVNEIILFGSAARGEASKESDVDIFFNTTKNEKSVKKKALEGLDKFYKSKVYETFSLRGISNPIHIEAGNLNEWKLKRSLISDGIVLFGKYKESPKNLKPFVYININPVKNIAKRNKVIRKIFGRKEEKYSQKGLISHSQGKKLSPTSFMIPKENSKDILEFLQSEKLDFKFFEFWAD